MARASLALWQKIPLPNCEYFVNSLPYSFKGTAFDLKVNHQICTVFLKKSFIDLIQLSIIFKIFLWIPLLISVTELRIHNIYFNLLCVIMKSILQ